MRDTMKPGAADAPALAARIQLERIAGALGCPAAAFFTGDGLPADLAQRNELLTLWDALKTEAGRQAVLGHVRAVAASE